MKRLNAELKKQNEEKDQQLELLRKRHSDSPDDEVSVLRERLLKKKTLANEVRH